MTPKYKYIYESQHSKPNIILEIKELIRYRFLLGLMVKNNLVTRYKRSVLGMLWTILNPLLMMVVISLAFSLLFGRLPSYPVFVLSGILLWNFFLQTTVKTSTSLVWGGGLLKRIYFPRSTFVFSNTGSGIINLLISFFPLFTIMIYYKHPFTTAMFFLPVSIFLTSIFALGVSFFLSAFAVFFPDIVDLYQAIMRALFYLTPVMYPIDILPAAVSKYIQINPFYSFITIFRAPIYDGKLPPLDAIGIATAYALTTFLFGSVYFVRKSNEIAYRI